MEQPGSRHWQPAARNTASSPSASAWAFTSPLPGTTSTFTPGATRRPLSTAAASRRSSIRPLVQEPMNTTSTASPSRIWPWAMPM